MSMTGGRQKILMTLFLCLTATPLLHAGDVGDRDKYKWRVEGAWWFSNPTGYIQGADSYGYFDLNKDFSFGSYQMGSRLKVHHSGSAAGVQLTQKGPTAGIEASW